DQRARKAVLARVHARGERAKAVAEAREQRKRRRVQLQLAGAIGLLALTAVGFAWWQDRQARALETEHRVQSAQTREAVGAFLGQCEDALRGDDAEMASIALAAAEKRAAEGGAHQLDERLASCRKELAVLRELDKV